HGGLPAGLGDSAELRRDLSSWAGCIAGALTDQEYRTLLADAGFAEIELEATRHYTLEDLGTPLPAWAGAPGEQSPAEVASRFAATFVRAAKVEPRGWPRS